MFAKGIRLGVFDDVGMWFFLAFFLFVRDKDEVICTFGNERERVNVWENWNLMVTGRLGLFI